MEFYSALDFSTIKDKITFSTWLKRYVFRFSFHCAHNIFWMVPSESILIRFEGASLAS